ncbi:hypothetical protein SISNIDRAFT_483904 [Sistotremastrum niveocremeum HHB9708]|uniref:F-box domain-containing protein n=1 Tax=Sistotremastrum niveocremeum HHB9708 TaxID=1314777 RepID=A0A164X6R3_9AGAM|nr:hypothetical protein SISNIDRAFT_483904 [Sistotremastrum niveocremeum HHB9708]
MALEKLPVELILQVLRGVRIIDVLALSHVCHELREMLISLPEAWKHALDGELCHMVQLKPGQSDLDLPELSTISIHPFLGLSFCQSASVIDHSKTPVYSYELGPVKLKSQRTICQHFHDSKNADIFMDNAFTMQQDFQDVLAMSPVYVANPLGSSNNSFLSATAFLAINEEKRSLHWLHILPDPSLIMVIEPREGTVKLVSTRGHTRDISTDKVEDPPDIANRQGVVKSEIKIPDGNIAVYDVWAPSGGKVVYIAILNQGWWTQALGHGLLFIYRIQSETNILQGPRISLEKTIQIAPEAEQNMAFVGDFVVFYTFSRLRIIRWQSDQGVIFKPPASNVDATEPIPCIVGVSIHPSQDVIVVHILDHEVEFLTCLKIPSELPHLDLRETRILEFDPARTISLQHSERVVQAGFTLGGDDWIYHTTIQVVKPQPFNYFTLDALGNDQMTGFDPAYPDVTTTFRSYTLRETANDIQLVPRSLHTLEHTAAAKLLGVGNGFSLLVNDSSTPKHTSHIESPGERRALPHTIQLICPGHGNIQPLDLELPSSFSADENDQKEDHDCVIVGCDVVQRRIYARCAGTLRLLQY